MNSVFQKMMKRINSLIVVYLILVMPMYASFVMAEDGGIDTTTDGTTDTTIIPAIEFFSIPYASSDTLKITWIPTLPSLEYDIYREGELVGTVIGQDNVEELFYVDTGLDEFFNYYYRIEARLPESTAGSGTITDQFLARTKQATASAELSDVQVEIESGTPVINFNTDEVVSGTIFYWLSGTEKESMDFLPTTDLQTEYSISLSSLQVGQNYIYEIEVCNAADVCTKSEQGAFYNGIDMQAPPTNNIICPISSSSRLATIIGNTELNSIIDVYVADLLRFSQGVDASGTFKLEGVPLLRTETTVVKLVVRDVSGNEAEKICTIGFDNTPPNVQIDPIPSITSEGALEFNLTTDERIHVTVNTLPAEDKIAPGKPTDISVVENDVSKIRIEWTAPEGVDDISNYVVYRDGVAITTTRKSETSFSDSKASTGIFYEYKVRAVDTSCNLGQSSDIAYATSMTGSGIVEGHTEIFNLCEGSSPEIDQDVVNELKKRVSLSPGLNKIAVLAVDDAGNTFTKEYLIEYDSERPEFIQSNLADLADNSIYVKAATVRGLVSEKSTVYIIVNDDETYEIETDSDGSFSEQITLTRSIYFSSEEDEDGASIGIDRADDTWPNEVEMYAVDRSGQKSETKNAILNFAVCGSGSSDWQVNIDNVLPSEIIPRHLIDGIATLGYSFELEYLGSGEAPKINSVIVKKAPVNTFHRANYDLDWISENSIAINKIPDWTYGYVQMRFDAVDPTLAGEEWTMFEKEQELSKNHEGHCLGSEITFGLEEADDIDPFKMGCLKVPVIMEISYDDANAIDGNGHKIQKHCVDMSVYITPRVPPDFIPTALLQAGIDITNATANAIETIQELTTPLRQYSLYGCLGSYVANMGATLIEGLSCVAALPFMKTYGIGFEDGSVIPVDGKGVEIEEGMDGYDSAKLVVSCFNSKVFTENTWGLTKALCDRVMCGAIPSYETYVEANRGNAQDLSSIDNVKDIFMADDSYCANVKETAETPVRTIYWPNLPTDKGGLQEMKDLYDLSKSTDLDSDTGTSTGLKSFDAKLKVASGFLAEGGETWAQKYPELCEEEYMREYKSACPFADPYVESFCKYAENDNTVFDGTIPSNDETNLKLAKATFDKKCKTNSTLGTLRDVADSISLCKAGENAGIYVRLVDQQYYIIDETTPDNTRVVMFTEGGGSVFKGSSDAQGFDEEIESRGYAIINQTRVTFLTSKYSSANIAQDDFATLANGGSCKATTPGDACAFCMDGKNECCPGEGDQKIPPAIANYICQDSEPTEKNVIDPTSGIIESLRCLCFNAIDAYLTQIRQVMELVRDCFQTIKVTGDGSSGVCQNVLTVYVCDIFYYAFSCISDYASSGSGSSLDDLENEDGGLGFQNFFTGISLAGAKMEQGVGGRYGGTALFDALFVEKKLINSVCLFAFTGEWPLDFEQLFLETSITSIPIEPILFCSGDRRFQSFDPISGVATYVYTVAPYIQSGAEDTNYRIELICSTDNCPNGELCDCAHIGTETKLRVGVFGSGTLDQGEELNSEELIVIDGVTDTVNKGLRRYDALRLSATYKNNQGETVTREAECDINEVGGAPPALCKFDLISADPVFRCAILTGQGSSYFSPFPPTQKDKYYFNEQSSVEVSFNPISIIKESNDPANQISRRLRVSAEDQNGEPYNWYQNTNDEAFFDITTEGMNTITSIPSFEVETIDLISSLTDDCAKLESNGPSIRGEKICSGFDSIKLSDMNVDTGGLNGAKMAFGFWNSQTKEFTPNSDELISLDNIGDSRLVYSSGDVEIDVTINPSSSANEDSYIIIGPSKSELGSMSRIFFKFEIVDENNQVVSYLNQVQSSTQAFEFLFGDDPVEEISEKPAEDDICKPVGYVSEKSRCYCGPDTCYAGQICCKAGKNDRDEFTAGQCVTPYQGYDASSNSICDDVKPPITDLKLTIEDGFLQFNDLKDEANIGQIISDSIQLFVHIVPVGQTQESLDAKHVALRNIGKQETINSKIVTFYSRENSNFLLSNVVKEDGCHNIKIDIIDQVGNLAEGVSRGSLNKEGDEYTYFEDPSCPSN